MASINLTAQTAENKKVAEARVKVTPESYFELEEAWGTKRDFAYAYISNGEQTVNVRITADELQKIEEAARNIRFKLELKAAKQKAEANPW